MLFRQRVKLPRVRIGFRVSPADDPKRRLRADSGLCQFQDTFARRDGGGADEPLPASGFGGGQKNLLDAVGETFEQLTGSRELLMQFGVENTRRVLCWDNTSS